MTNLFRLEVVTVLAGAEMKPRPAFGLTVTALGGAEAWTPEALHASEQLVRHLLGVVPGHVQMSRDGATRTFVVNDDALGMGLALAMLRESER